MASGTGGKEWPRVGGGMVLLKTWATSYTLTEIADRLRVERKWLENALAGTVGLPTTTKGKKRRFDPEAAAAVAVFVRLLESGLTKAAAAEIARELGPQVCNPDHRRVSWTDGEPCATISLDARAIRRMFDFTEREATEAEKAAYRKTLDERVGDDMLARWREREDEHYAAALPSPDDGVAAGGGASPGGDSSPGT